MTNDFYYVVENGLMNKIDIRTLLEDYRWTNPGKRLFWDEPNNLQTDLNFHHFISAGEFQEHFFKWLN